MADINMGGFYPRIKPSSLQPYVSVFGSAQSVSKREYQPPEGVKKWPTAMQLRSILQRYDEKIGQHYVGQIPEPVATAFGSASQAVRILDQLAPMLRTMDWLTSLVHVSDHQLGRVEDGSKNKAPDIRLTLRSNQQQITLRYLGKGASGIVYRLSLGENQPSYALKTFFWPDPESSYNKGMYGETSTALFLSHQFEDVATFYCARPDKGWKLQELITPDASVALRKGTSIQHDPNVVLFDDERSDSRGPGNHINGIRFDYGGIIHRDYAVQVRSLADYKKAFKNECVSLQETAAWQIPDLPLEERKEAIIMALKSPIASVQVGGVFGLAYLASEASRHDVLPLVLKSPHPIVLKRLAFKMRYFSESDRLTVFKKLMQHPASDVKQAGLAQLKYLDFVPELQKKAYHHAITSRDAALQQAAASQLKYFNSFPSEWQWAALQQATQTNDPLTQIVATLSTPLYTLAEKTQYIKRYTPALEQSLSSAIQDLQIIPADNKTVGN